MVVLSLDTTTRAGSAAVWRDDVVIAERVGDRTKTHGQRLPRELADLLAFCDLRIAEVDLFGVAAGPGSFTGLRVGIATMQGLAFATGKPIAGVSTLDALARAAVQHVGPTKLARHAEAIGAWMDAQRDEVFSALYGTDGVTMLEAAAVDSPDRTLERWMPTSFVFIGDGAIRYREAIDRALGDRVRDIIDPPPLAGIIAQIAAEKAARDEAGPAHALRPVYVRRPDAELARERARSRE